METVKYKSIKDLNDAIFKNISKFPKDIDLIVGIPRSGMLPANIVALYLNKPYTDIESFLEGKVYACGFRGNFIKEKNVKNILVIDDSVSSGSAMNSAKQKLKEAEKSFNIKYAAIFVRSDSRKNVDVFCEIVDGLRIFQWNLFHHRRILGAACLDIDGVLCEDPMCDDDGPEYHKFLITATPKFIPSVKIKTLISCRLEKYRAETEWWLKKHGIEYENLILLNLPNKESRMKWGKHGEYKANEYAKSQYSFFIESSLREAKIIKEKTGKTVFCIETMSII